MYEIIENNNFEFLKRKICQTYEPQSYIDCLGHSHQIRQFRLVDDGTVEILYKHQINANTYTITLQLALLSFNLDIQRSNRLYHQYLYDQCNLAPPINHNIVRKNLQVWGITVGDLLKHFYYNGGVESLQRYFSQTNSEDQDPEITKETGNRCLPFQMVAKFLKKVPSVETSTTDSTHALGLYVHHMKTIYLWDHLTMKASADNTFQGFCRQILYFSASTIQSLIEFDSHKERVINRESWRQLFNQLSNDQIVSQLFKYFFHNEDPELAITNEIYYFDPPKSLPLIFKYFYEKTNDQNYLYFYHQVMKKLNKNQQNQLKEKYQPIVLQSIEKVPNEYPIYSFRNIFLKQWTCTTSGFKCDLDNLRSRYLLHKKAITDQKYKYRCTRSQKIIPLNQYLSRNHLRHSIKGHFKEKRRGLQNQIKEAYQILEDENSPETISDLQIDD